MILAVFTGSGGSVWAFVHRVNSIQAAHSLSSITLAGCCVTSQPVIMSTHHHD